MGRNEKRYPTIEARILRLETRARNEELAGQTKLSHYHANKDKMHHCDMCGKDIKSQRHRIEPRGKYEDTNVFYACKQCHEFLHTLIDRANCKTRADYITILMIAKAEIRTKYAEEKVQGS